MYCHKCGGLVKNKKCIECNEEMPQELLELSDEQEENEKDKIPFILAYVLWPASMFFKADNKEAYKFHSSQGFLVFILELLSIVSVFVPQLGLLLFIALFSFTAFFIYTGITNVLKGEKEKLPLIGDFAFFK